MPTFFHEDTKDTEITTCACTKPIFVAFVFFVTP